LLIQNISIKEINEGVKRLFIINKDLKGKSPSESSIENHKITLFDGNVKSDEVIFGGRILNLVNDVARSVANSHCEITCYTIGIDFIRYYSPIKRGDILTCKAQVNHVWENNLEVGVIVIAEDFRTLEQKKILSAYFIFEARMEKSETDIKNELDIPQIIPESEKEKKRYLDAEKRKIIREKRKSFS